MCPPCQHHFALVAQVAVLVGLQAGKSADEFMCVLSSPLDTVVTHLR